MRRWRTLFMSSMYPAWCLLVLLIAGQQAALLHELGHLTGAERAEQQQTGSKHVTDTACALCPAFAQVATPAFGHSVTHPVLLLEKSEGLSAPRLTVLNAAVPTPRSRGPPALT